MKTVEVAPAIHRVYPNLERDESIRKQIERWGWHNIYELTACANDYILKMWPISKSRWGKEPPFTPTSLINAFSLVNGFRRRPLNGSYEPLLSWASPDFLAIDSPPEFGVCFEKALLEKEFFVPAAWGIKIMELVEHQILKVFFEWSKAWESETFDCLHGLQLVKGNRERVVEINKKFVRNLSRKLAV